MSNKILTREESDFFSPPLTAGPLRNELFPVRYSGFARDIFSQSPEPCVCAVLAASDGEMRRLLENIANAAQNEGVLLVCDPSPEQGLPAGITTPLAKPGQPCENPVKFFTFYVREADLCYNEC